jgi:hypothetical protein
MYDTPVLFLIFNRPESTAIVFEKIRQQKPSKLYIAADGPRKNKGGENEICDLTRRSVIEKIDWECQVKTLLRDENLGCGRAPSEAISWFFDQEDEGIILEDDCVPNESFFFFCAELLEYYRNNPKIMHISGVALNDETKPAKTTYHFSKYAASWGWATWKRAWKQYNYQLEDAKFYSRYITSAFRDPFERMFWKTVLRSVSGHNVDVWDYQWMFAIWKADGLCVNTNYNFIVNIGFNELATHTTYKNPYPDLKTNTITTIVHPKKIERNKKGEAAFLENGHNLKRKGYLGYFLFRGGNLIHKIKKIMQKKGA